MYPLKMKPIFKDYLWGGTRLKEIYNKDIPFAIGAESWEASVHPNGLSVIANGELAGKPLADVVGGDFPLLFKLIDARDNLSVQVHPNDDFAAKFENGSLGKTELWYVLEAEPGSQLVYGLKENVTKESFKSAIERGEVESQLQFVNVKKGDCFFIPAGLVHAIGAGILIAEIQQNSDTTYRVYDYKRVGADGKPRELHVDKSLEVIGFAGNLGDSVEPLVTKIDENIVTKYASCEYFTFEKIEVKSSYDATVNNCEILFFADGEGEISGGEIVEKFSKGDTFVIPREVGNYEIRGNCVILKSE